MKNIIKTLILSTICLLAFQLKAQDGYTYTLVQNSDYNYSISAVPNASASNFATSVQSYGFTILVPDGVTATITSSLGNSAGATFFNGNDVAQPTIDGYLITETLGSPASLPAPSAGMNTPMVTVQINGSPMMGSIIILANDSPLAIAVTPLKSFMQADMIDDAMAMFTNVVDPNASALSGTSSYDFATLAVEEFELVEFKLVPNPASDIVKIEVPLGTQSIQTEVFDSTGKQIQMKLSNENTMDVSKLSSGMYLVTIIIDDYNKVTKKLLVD